MRELNQAEILVIFGGGVQNYVPSDTQLSHKHYTLPSSFDRVMQDSVIIGLEGAFGGNFGMTTYEREVALQSQFSPDNVFVDTNDSTIGYSIDGSTTYFDEDGNGAGDTALRRGPNGETYIFGSSGWAVF